MSARAWGLFGVVSLVWGLPYLFIKLAIDDVSPLGIAFARVAIGAAVLLPFAARSGGLRGLRPKLGWLTLFAATEIAIPFPLIAIGEQRISSSLTAILIASMPLVVSTLAIRFDAGERATGVRLLGLVVGLAGVIALLGIDVAGRPRELVGALAALVATVGYACGPFVIKRRLGGVSPLGPVAGALAIATFMLAPFAALSLPPSMPSTQALASLAVLGVVCSALAFVLYFTLVAEIGPGRASVITYLNPVVAVALGVAILGEHVTAGAVAGLLLILAGSWLSTDGRLPPGPAGLWARRSARAVQS